MSSPDQTGNDQIDEQHAAARRFGQDLQRRTEEARQLSEALTPTNHRLKCHTVWMNEIVSGRKTFDVRSTKDRVFQAGDTLELFYWEPGAPAQIDPQHQSANSGYFRRVTAVYHGLPGVDPDYCVMCIGPLDRHEPR